MPAFPVKFAARAQRDLLETARWTAGQWGHQQADRYIEAREALCRESIQPLTQVRLYRSTFKIRKSARHGHHVFRRFVEKALEVIRIIRTARDWRQLKDLRQWPA